MKAFIFDFDGVIVDSETLWKKREQAFLPDLIGKEVFNKIEKEILGSTLYTIYDLAKKNGSKVTEKEFYKKYNAVQSKVYDDSSLTKNVELLLDFLIERNIKIGLVSATEQLEIKKIIGRLTQKDAFSIIVSLGDRIDIRPKPFPDGYFEAMEKLEVIPKETIILEDSKKGVQAAVSSGAFTICFTQHLSPSNIARNANWYAKNMKEVIKYLKEL